jgi:anhydro-N-acetylmuramic acid kinase
MSKNFTSLGFMSGTSADGVDASVILSNGTDFCEILKEKYYEYDKDLFNQIIEIREQINSIKDLRKYKKAVDNLEKSITLFHAKIFKDITNETKVELIGWSHYLSQH